MTDETEPEGGSTVVGGCVVLAAVLAAGAVLWALSPAVAVVLVWVVGWGAIVWAAKRPPKSVPRTPDHSPPPPGPPPPAAKQQVTMVRDTSHPNRWVVTAPSRWLTEIPNKEVGTE